MNIQSHVIFVCNKRVYNTAQKKKQRSAKKIKIKESNGE